MLVPSDFVVELLEAWAGGEHPLDAFEVAEPFGDVGGLEFGGGKSEAGGAGGAFAAGALFGDFVAVGGKGAFTEAAALVEVFAEEEEHGDAGCAADGEFFGDGVIPGFEVVVAGLGGEGGVALIFGDEAELGHDVADADVESGGFVGFLSEEGFFDAFLVEDAPFDEDFADGFGADIFGVGGGAGFVEGVVGRGGIGVEILDAVDEAEINEEGVLGEFLEDGAGGDAVTAPGTGEAEDVHFSAEGSEELLLLGVEGDGIVGGFPAGEIFRGGIFLEVVFVAEGTLKNSSEVQRHGGFSGKSKRKGLIECIGRMGRMFHFFK